MVVSVGRSLLRKSNNIGRFSGPFGALRFRNAKEFNRSKDIFLLVDNDRENLPKGLLYTGDYTWYELYFPVG